MIGSALLAACQADSWGIHRLVRSPSGRDTDIHWPADADGLDPALLRGLDAVVNLAGEPIVGRWTKAKKQAIYESRVPRTRQLCAALAELDRKPAVLIQASAVGVYGDRGGEVLDESTSRGGGFLADVAADWEEATRPAQDAGIRVVCLRIGVVLSRKGGALAKMLPIFKLGGGGVIGDGSQYWSWISLDDVVRVIRFAIEHDELQGPVNTVSPEPVVNRDFTKALGAALKRPAIIPVPAFAARLAFGELADESFLASVRVIPRKLLDAGYSFRHAELGATLRELIKEETPADG